MFYLFCFLLTLYSHVYAFGEIIEAYDLSSVRMHFHNLDSDTLVMWDVDETLIIPGDRILHPNNNEVRKEFSKQYLAKHPLEKAAQLKSAIWSSLSFKVIDPLSIKIINDLKALRVPVMALTAMQTQPHSGIACMSLWRYNHLKEHGIDFTDFLPHYPRLEWNQKVSKWSQEHWNQTELGDAHPIFFKGILATDSPEKGPILVEFLKRVDWSPKRVIFIDNEWSFLLSVQEALAEIGIPFLGIHYRAVEVDNSAVDHDLAHRQFQHLIDHGVWLNDNQVTAVRK